MLQIAINRSMEKIRGKGKILYTILHKEDCKYYLLISFIPNKLLDIFKCSEEKDINSLYQEAMDTKNFI
jgi:hypothetical protein